MNRKSLEELLTTLDVSLNAFAIYEIGADWRLHVEPLPSVVCYFVISGSGLFEFSGRRVPIAAGAIIVVPPRFEKSFSGGDDVKREAFASDSCVGGLQEPRLVRARSGDPSLVLGSATLSAKCADGFGLFDKLREPLVAGTHGNPLLAISFESLVRELARPNFGSTVLTHCLMKQAMVLLLRNHLKSHPESPIFNGLGDHRLVRAACAMADSPGEQHTVTSLAELAGMSRSSFMTHFAEQFETTPHEFLQKVRMRVAAELLRATEMPIKCLVSEIGYASRSHFSNAFSRMFGTDPSSYRQQFRCLASRGEIPRLAALRNYEILDTPPDGSFDRVTAVAATLFSAPIAIVSLVDEDRIWFKSRHGVDIHQVDRRPGLCASAILQDDAYIVEDATSDVRTLANPLVAGEFGLRFYAAAPLRTRDGYNLGTLCVIDREPRKAHRKQIEQLEHLAGIVMDQMELRLAARRAFAEFAGAPSCMAPASSVETDRLTEVVG